MTGADIRVSPGLWATVWKRLRGDVAAMASLAVVAFFMAMLALSASGLVASDWASEVGVSYAPPAFAASGKGGAPDAPPLAARTDVRPENPVDPLRGIIRQLRAEMAGRQAVAQEDYGIADPLEKELTEIRAARQAAGAADEAARKATLPFGADKWGHDIIKKTIKGGETSIVVGLVSALLATAIGTALGALAGYFGGRVDDFFNWFYSIFTSIPYLLLILAVAAVLHKKGVLTIILILGLTGWTGVFRLVRAEYLRHKEREYVMAANAIGASHWRRMASHIFPNVSHVPLVQMSILTVGFIKSEVILSFLGFGVPVGVVSWGSMLNEAQNELILGKWWQLAAATLAMAVLVTAFSLFTDSLRDALDPRLKES
ncbi:MAG: ABC transporter permease [Burkholderiaceae bacterium]|jgi:peptide/nickel transport system permease protein|nr:ABC transporter permease [Burkholderiaceae bacterium]